jgi:hypothetical protein
MITVEKLTKKPSLFLSFTGLNVSEFEKLSNQMSEAEIEHEKKRLSNSKRRRAVGGGRKFIYPLPERLLMLLMYYRIYPTYALLGFLFDVDETTVLRNIDKLIPLFERFLPLPEKMMPRREKLEGLDDLLKWYPEFKVVVDVTEQAIRRPVDKENQKKYYSGKKKRHTVKTQIMANKHGLLFKTFGGVEGKRHDFQIFQDSGIEPMFPPEVGIEGDRAYQGAAKLFPGRTFYIPFKASRWYPITEYQKIVNKLINRSRVLCEHVIERLKRFKILKDIFRNRLSKHESIFKQIAGIVNLKTMNRIGLQFN